MTEADEGLLDLLRMLDAAGYRFVTPTPETHRRVLERDAGRLAKDLRDVFGWNLPFEDDVLPASVVDLLERSGLIVQGTSLSIARIRVAWLEGKLFLHSPFPTDDPDSVFFGPDSYRYARFLAAELRSLPPVRRLVDIGAGSGLGAVTASALLPGARVTATDINPLALRFARINALHAGVTLETVETSGLDSVDGPIDLVIANPPFVVDPAKRLYRDGGDMNGAGLSLDWTLAAASRVEPGGTILLYTGSAIVEGRDALREALEERLPGLGCNLRYGEIDPDIFGELVTEPAYAGVERIAAVGAVIRKARLETRSRLC